MENIENLNTIVEANTVGGAAPEVATTDENLISATEMFQQAALPSLGRQIFPVIQVNGPTGAIFNIKKKDGVNDFEVLRAEVQVIESAPIKTGLSQEAIQDMQARFGRKARDIVGTLLRGLSNDQENTETIAFLEANSLSVPQLNLSDSLNAETTLFEITQKVNELVLRANAKNMRTFEAYCVLPYIPGAAVSSLNNYVGGDDIDERGLFLAQIGQVEYFMNPDATSTTAYVGLKDQKNASRSAAVFSPYVADIIEATDSVTGNITMHIFNRFAITASPLNETDNEMMFKFTIDI